MAYTLSTDLCIGGVWTPIPLDVYTRSPVVIERGRRDEDAVVGPGKVRLQLNNRHGRYSPLNARSPLYGLIGRNTPIRSSLTGPESYLATTGASGDNVGTPDHASLDVTGDIDVQVELTAHWDEAIHQTIIGKWSATDGNRSWIWRMLGGQATFVWSPTGLAAAAITATVDLPPMLRRSALRATLDVNNGAGGWTCTFYTAASLDGPWTFIRAVTGTGTTSIYSGTAPLEIAPTQVVTAGNRLPWRGRLHRAEVRAGISGTLVASPDTRALTPGTTSWADSAGRTWTVAGGAAVTNREFRFHAEVSSWPARWDVSGRDVFVPTEASGILRRLGQGKKALASPLRRRIPTVGKPRAYWPMEEGRTAVQAYSPIPGVAPLVTTGLEFAANDTLLGSSSLPRITSAATMAGSVPTHTATGQWLLALVFYWETTPASSTRLLTFTTTGTARTIILNVDTNSALLEGYSSTGSTVFSIPTSTAGTTFHGAWTRLELNAESSGGNVTFRLGWTDVSGAGFGATSTVAATAGTITGIATTFGPLAADVSLGHIGIFDSSNTSVYDRADDGWLGESASSRFLRLTTEEGVPAGAGIASTALGPQRPDKLLTLLGRCEESDGGVLYESLDSLALRYRSRKSFYNQPIALTLDYDAEGHVAPPLEPTDDDQRTRNDRTVNREGGSSARAVAATGPMSVQDPPDGIGVYDDAVTRSVATDSQLDHMAWWQLHLGTWEGGRYPSVHINLAAAPSLAAAVLALDIGDRIQIINPPPWLPPGPIDLMIEGWTETIRPPNRWDLVLNCSPAGPWTVAVADDPVHGRADTSGTVLSADVDADDTVFALTTNSGRPWTTDLADLPFDVQVGGEVCTVTMVNGSRQDRFQRTTTSGWGTSDAGQVWTTTGGSASDYSVQGA